MAYWRLHYHLVWATSSREPLIDSATEELIHRTLYGKAKELGLLVHTAGGIEDHLHVVVSIPPRFAVAECVGQLKGATAHRVNLENGRGAFRWQGGYGALSLGERSLPTVLAYVRNQREHHRGGSLLRNFESSTDADEDVVVAPAPRPGLKPRAE